MKKETVGTILRLTLFIFFTGISTLLFLNLNALGTEYQQLSGQLQRLTAKVDRLTAIEKDENSSAKCMPLESTEGRITLFEPCIDTLLVENRITISGSAVGIFENNIGYLVKSDASEELSGSIMPDVPPTDVGGEFLFAKEINISTLTDNPSATTLTVEVFWESPKDGSKLDLITKTIYL